MLLQCRLQNLYTTFPTLLNKNRPEERIHAYDADSSINSKNSL